VLDFPDPMGIRQRAEIIAARWSEIEEGQLLHLWVYLPDSTLLENEDSDLPMA
jgi:hypothetical protein